MRRFLLSLVFLFLAALPSSAVTLCNNAWMNTSTTGTGTLTLTTAVSGAQTFADCGITDGQVVRYRIFNSSAWEVGSGTYTTSGTTLSRTVLESSNADAAISISGAASVIITPLTADLTSETTPIDSAPTAGTDYYFTLDGGVLKRALIPTVDVQTMTSTGSGDSWDKPTGGQTMCMVELWAAGGSGGEGTAAFAAGGGGGGQYTRKFFLMSALSSTEQVTIGTGGAAQTTTSTAGNVGGNTTFGSGATLVTAYGGGGGGHQVAPSGGGDGGGPNSVGVPNTRSAVSTTFAIAQVIETGRTEGLGGRVSTNLGESGKSTVYNGAGGGGASADAAGANGRGGDSVYGGAGGGSAAEDSSPGAGAGGTSQFGGAGGAGAFDANNGTAGTQPGGGGGGSEAGDSGAGANGKGMQTCW